MFFKQNKQEEKMKAGIIGAAIGSAIGATTVLLIDKQNRVAIKSKMTDGMERVSDTVSEKAQELRDRTQQMFMRPQEARSTEESKKASRGGSRSRQAKRKNGANT